MIRLLSWLIFQLKYWHIWVLDKSFPPFLTHSHTHTGRGKLQCGLFFKWYVVNKFRFVWGKTGTEMHFSNTKCDFSYNLKHRNTNEFSLVCFIRDRFPLLDRLKNTLKNTRLPGVSTNSEEFNQTNDPDNCCLQTTGCCWMADWLVQFHRLTIRSLAITVFTAASIFSVSWSAVMLEWPMRAMLKKTT